MMHLNRNSLEIRFPELHENAGVKVDFQRTLRVPDDGKNHYLPPGLGKFPLRHIEDFDLGSNNYLKKRGGVIMPMFQADALWLNFSSINITGEVGRSRRERERESPNFVNISFYYIVEMRYDLPKVHNNQ